MTTNPNDLIHKSELYPQDGLTKREYFAAMAMQGIIAAHNIYIDGIDNVVNAKTAINAADALINELNKTPTNDTP